MLIVIVGLLAAGASGVAAYRQAGMYGDTFLNYGLYRVSEGGAQGTRIIRRVVTDDGLVLHFVFHGSRLMELRVMPGAAGPSDIVRIDPTQGLPGRFDLDRRAIAWDAREQRVRIAVSLGQTGRVDAWQYWGTDGALKEIHISRLADGVIDRREHYDQGQLARVEEDTDRDGRADRWQTYEAGILMEETVDRDGDGRPDGPQN